MSCVSFLIEGDLVRDRGSFVVDYWKDVGVELGMWMVLVSGL